MDTILLALLFGISLAGLYYAIRDLHRSIRRFLLKREVERFLNNILIDMRKRYSKCIAQGGSKDYCYILMIDGKRDI